VTRSGDAARETSATAASEQERLQVVAAYDVIGADQDDPVVIDLQALCETAATVVGVPTAVVNLFDDRIQHQVAAFGMSPKDCERDESMCQTTLAAGHDICVSDAAADPRYASSPWVDGTLARIRFYCSAILRSPAGHAIGTLCVFDDQPREITDQQRRTVGLLARQVIDVLELRLRSRELQRANDELARSADRLASFAGQISHDLKAPITAIIGFTELLSDMDEIAGDPTIRAYVARCSSAGKRMLAMIDDLLAFARVGGSLRLVPNPIAPLVADVVADLGAAARDATVTATGPDVVADPSQLRALLQNLIGNAVLYRGISAPVVEVISERVGDNAIVRVVDNGSGIPPERRDDVLRPLVRLRKEVPGAGLGLAVSVRIAAAHGGTIRLDGAPGGGTAAIVTLPLTPDGRGHE
jgi:signal transduction histidine kinase